MWYKNVDTSLFPFVIKHAFDGRTGRHWQYCALHYMQSHSKIMELGQFSRKHETGNTVPIVKGKGKGKGSV